MTLDYAMAIMYGPAGQRGDSWTMWFRCGFRTACSMIDAMYDDPEFDKGVVGDFCLVQP